MQIIATMRNGTSIWISLRWLYLQFIYSSTYLQKWLKPWYELGLRRNVCHYNFTATDRLRAAFIYYYSKSHVICDTCYPSLDWHSETETNLHWKENYRNNSVWSNIYIKAYYNFVFYMLTWCITVSIFNLWARNANLLKNCENANWRMHVLDGHLYRWTERQSDEVVTYTKRTRCFTK